MPVLEAGQKFERYRIIQCVGSSISGESYAAEDSMLLRKVTLKLIHPWSNLPDASRRQFFREMQGISVLNSPYLASVLDYGEVDGRLYVARRYVTSGSLLGNDGRSWFCPPLNITDAIRYCHQLAQALEHIHQHTCLHGGLTFSNILVLRGPNLDNEPDYAPFLLADVGLANFVRRFGELQTSLFPVTAAPEQLGQRVTPASDQFALAVLLYFWLTGRPPFLGTPEEIAQLKLTATIAPPGTFNAHVTTEQTGIILRALSVYPEERYPSVSAFAQALLTTLSSQLAPEAPRPTPNPYSVPQLAPETPQPEMSQTHPALESQQVPQPETPQPPIIPEPTPQTEPDIPQSLPQPEVPQPDLQPETPQPDPIPQPVPITRPAPITEYCPNCKKVRTMLSPRRITLNNGHPALQGVCSICRGRLLHLMPMKVTPTALPTTTPQSELSTEEPTPISQALPAIEQESSLPHLIIVSPYAEEPYEVLLEHTETTLGRAGSSDILLDKDNLTSRHHALLRHEHNTCILYDRSSANGVFVNGQKLVAEIGYPLTDGDHISIGNYELIFRSGSAKKAHEKDNPSFASVHAIPQA